jgi:GTP cyclohydrolase I
MQDSSIARRDGRIAERTTRGDERETRVSERVTYRLPEFVVYPGSGKLEQVMSQRAEEQLPLSMLAAAREILAGLGEDPGREGLLDTPKRMASMLREVTTGYAVDLDAVINGAIFNEDYHEPIVVNDITYYSMCEHHVLPFHGKAQVAYIPNGKVVGLSKIPRIVETFSRRLQVQERLTAQIADFIDDRLQPRGVAVVLEGVHFCAVMRGVQQPTSSMRTESLRGVFRDDPALVARLLGSPHGTRA